MEDRTKPQHSTWHRFLDGKTSGQRFVLALGALAAALLAIGGLIAGVGVLVGDDANPAPFTAKISAGETVVTNQSNEADDFVRFLLGTDGAPVPLNHKVIAPDAGSHCSTGSIDDTRARGPAKVRRKAAVRDLRVLRGRARVRAV